MLAPDNSSDEEDDAENAFVGKQKYVSGDDLGDSFTLDDEHNHKKGWVDEILGRKDADGTESEGDDSAEDSDGSQDDEDGDSDDESKEDDSSHGVKHSLKDWEQSDDDILDTKSEDDEEASEGGKEQDEGHPKGIVDHDGPKKAHKSSIAKSSKDDGISEDTKKLKKDTKHQSKPELPYIIDAPESFDQFLSLLANCSNSDIILIIGRIRASNAIQLTEKNLEKMQVHFLFIFICSHTTSTCFCF